VEDRVLRAYLTTTGALFAILAIAHLLRTIAESSRLATDPRFILEGPGIGLIAGGLCVWAWALLRKRPSTD
jgi:hypothetical protein